ncbi:MAG: hypothetical protein AAGF83_04960 [Cyanobacteria bacterium P01_G01_bin.67]
MMITNISNDVLSNSQKKLQGSSTLALSLKAQVLCVEGNSGQLTHVIINPTTLQVSHIVVEHPALFGSQTRLVPIDYVSSTAAQFIKLNCTQDELVGMELFKDTHYIENECWERETLYWPWDNVNYASDVLMSWSYPFPERMMSYLAVEKENLPLGELPLGQEAQVQASDGFIGKIDVLLVERNTRLLSGLVVQSGHNIFGRGHRGTEGYLDALGLS